MIAEDIKRLRPGDQVYWLDPDGGICSRTITIQAWSWIDEDDGAIRIVDVDGDTLECFITELL